MSEKEIEKKSKQYPIRPSRDFLNWIRNACSSGLTGPEEAREYFDTLTDSQQKALAEEYLKILAMYKV
ncbi:hypothetical protein KJ707_00145 [Patescibacteria group bacterium]|nr:hypothetical protein [Patescibacteria group bacterium]